MTLRICHALDPAASNSPAYTMAAAAGRRDGAVSPAMLCAIHQRLFTGVLPAAWAGRWSTQNIRKLEPVLGGDTVVYSSWDWIAPTLEYDFSEESRHRASYARMLRRDVAVSVRRFVSGIWQIHPFREGNTRTVMTLVVLYLRTFGFRVGAESFAHSRFLRDALVLANARHDAAGQNTDEASNTGTQSAGTQAAGIRSTADAPLCDFWDNMLFDAGHRLDSLRPNR